MTDRTTERNAEIWAAYVRGETQAAIGARYGITQQAVAKVVAQMRSDIPERIKEDVIHREVEFLDWARTEALTLWDAQGAPVTAGKDGDLVYDPETGGIVRDHAGRLAGLRTAVDISARLAKMLGLDAASRVDATVSGAETAAMAALAEEAARRVAGDA